MSDKHVIITGGSSGIGKALAKQLATKNYIVSIIARDAAKMQLTETEIRTACTNKKIIISSFVADVADKNAITQAIENAMKAHGAPDLLITSAGIANPGYFSELPLENFEQHMQINYLGTVYAIKAALPAMQKANKGHIVLISSGAAFTGIFGYTSYGASKFALRGLAEALRAEMKPLGITTSIVYPPDTDTPQLEQESKTKPIETKAISGSAKVMSADAVAHCIMQGIEKKKFAISPGFEMKMLNWINSIAAPLLYAYFDSIIKKAYKKKVKQATTETRV